MDMEVEELCKCFTLTDLAQEELVATMNLLSNVVSRGNHCLVNKLCTGQPLHKEAFKSTLRKIWRLAKTVCFHELGFDLILAKFEDCMDKKWVTWDSP